MAGMTSHIVFGVLYLLVAVAAFLTSERQKKEGKDFRLLRGLGFLMLLRAVTKIWWN
jgi:hypothetical protein